MAKQAREHPGPQAMGTLPRWARGHQLHQKGNENSEISENKEKGKDAGRGRMGQPCGLNLCVNWDFSDTSEVGQAGGTREQTSHTPTALSLLSLGRWNWCSNLGLREFSDSPKNNNSDILQFLMYTDHFHCSCT